MFDSANFMDEMSDLSSIAASPAKKTDNVTETCLMKEVLASIVEQLNPDDREQWLAFGKRFGAAQANNAEPYILKVQTLCSGCDGAIHTLQDCSISMHHTMTMTISLFATSFFFVSIQLFQGLMVQSISFLMNLRFLQNLDCRPFPRKPCLTVVAV